MFMTSFLYQPARSSPPSLSSLRSTLSPTQGRTGDTGCWQLSFAISRMEVRFSLTGVKNFCKSSQVRKAQFLWRNWELPESYGRVAKEAERLEIPWGWMVQPGQEGGLCREHREG